MFLNRQNFFYKWLRSIDGFSLVLVLILASIGVLMITSVSPIIADRLQVPPFYFAHRQFLFLFLAFVVMFFVSILSEKSIKILNIIIFALIILGMLAVVFWGAEVKGARRWINFYGLKIQPSEFLKPSYAMLCALILSLQNTYGKYYTFGIIGITHMLILLLLIMQPDIGMSVSISLITIIQLFLAGLPIYLFVVISILGISSMAMAYLLFPHVAYRINNFLSPTLGSNYQLSKALDAYKSGGFLGRGPGEGIIKHNLPDLHNDFIFAVIGEELGILFCILIILIYFCLVIRGIIQILQTESAFHMYAISGIIFHIAFQVLFNVAMSLGLLPTKGMPLPFISYGGSATISFGLAMGLYLNITRKRYTAFKL